MASNLPTQSLSPIFPIDAYFLPPSSTAIYTHIQTHLAQTMPQYNAQGVPAFSPSASTSVFYDLFALQPERWKISERSTHLPKVEVFPTFRLSFYLSPADDCHFRATGSHNTAVDLSRQSIKTHLIYVTRSGSWQGRVYLRKITASPKKEVQISGHSSSVVSAGPNTLHSN